MRIAAIILTIPCGKTWTATRPVRCRPWRAAALVYPANAVAGSLQRRRCCWAKGTRRGDTGARGRGIEEPAENSSPRLTAAPAGVQRSFFASPLVSSSSLLPFHQAILTARLSPVNARSICRQVRQRGSTRSRVLFSDPPKRDDKSRYFLLF